MAITIDPTYPVAGETVALSVTDSVTGLAPDLVQWEVLSVPPNSATALGPLVDENGDPIATFTPDVAGTYAVSAHLFETRYGEADTYESLSEVQSTSLNVGVELDFPIRTRLGHNVTIRCTVVGSTVRDAELVDWSTPLAYAGTKDSAVVTALANLVGVSVASLGNDLVAVSGEWVTKLNGHLANASAHTSRADTVNTLLTTKGWRTLSAVEIVDYVAERFIRHLLGSEKSDDPWHNTDDTKNVPMVVRAVDVPSAHAMVADGYFRCYALHLAQTSNPNSHDSADVTNVVAATESVLSILIRRFCEFIATQDPTIASGLPSGVNDAIALYGFRQVT